MYSVQCVYIYRLMLARVKRWFLVQFIMKMKNYAAECRFDFCARVGMCVYGFCSWYFVWNHLFSTFITPQKNIESIMLIWKMYRISFGGCLWHPHQFWYGEHFLTFHMKIHIVQKENAKLFLIGGKNWVLKTGC